MEQLLPYINLQNICLVVTIITGIIGVFQAGNAKNDINIFIHHEPIYPIYYSSNHKESSIGCIARCIIYILFILGIIYLTYSFYTSLLPSPTDQAKTIIQNFYNDINKKDYQSAYNLTKNGFSQKYKTFAYKFTNTEHDDLLFNSIKQISDKTIQVIVTVKAKEKSPAGEHISIYNYIYIIDLEQGNYKILTGYLY